MTRNAILPNGTIDGLTLGVGEDLVVRDHPQTITVEDTMQLTGDGTLRLVLASPDWGSTIIVPDGVNPRLDGTLSLIVKEDADVDAMMGNVFKLFDWGAKPPADECFLDLDTPDYEWDTDQLCFTGEVWLLSDGQRPPSSASPGGSAGPLEAVSPLSADEQEALSYGNGTFGDVALHLLPSEVAFDQLEVFALPPVGIDPSDSDPLPGAGVALGVVPVPEPFSMVLMVLGAGFLAMGRRRRNG
jgi:hypothetical protein